jgi:hypothetical protein
MRTPGPVDVIVIVIGGGGGGDGVAAGLETPQRRLAVSVVGGGWRMPRRARGMGACRLAGSAGGAGAEATVCRGAAW